MDERTELEKLGQSVKQSLKKDSFLEELVQQTLTTLVVAIIGGLVAYLFGKTGGKGEE